MSGTVYEGRDIAMLLTHDTCRLPESQSQPLSQRLPTEEHINLVFWFNKVQPMMGKNWWFDTLRADPSSSRQRQVCLQCLLVGWRVGKYIKATSVTAFSTYNGHTYKTHTHT